MIRFATILIVCLLGSRLTAVAAAGPGFDNARVFFETWCFDCHGHGAAEGDLALDVLLSKLESERDPQSEPDPQSASDTERWWTVLQNLRSGVMPPADAERPPAAKVDAAADWIKFDVFGIDPQNPGPGRPVIRRLNRTEYSNTLRDLTGTDYDARLILPPDDSGHGFDNVADALTFSPLLMEKYLHAAREVVSRTVPVETWIVPRIRLSGPDFRDADRDIRGNWHRAEQPARLTADFEIPEPGRYAVDVETRLHGSFDFDDSRYTVTLLVDGEPRETHEYGWDENKRIRTTWERDWPPGAHELAFVVTPVTDESEENDDETWVAFQIDSIVVRGPLGTDRFVHPEGYERFFHRDEPPQDPAARRTYAREVLRRFATHAFRSPVGQTTLDRLLTITEQSWQRPDSTFESGIARAFVAVLASPRFLFRMESAAIDDGSADPSAGADHALVSEYTLASRLSYFLWSTMPDDELFRLAEAGQLREHLPQQVDRMLADDRARDFIRNFAGQWLRTRDVIQTRVDPIVVLGHGEEWEEILTAFRANRRRFFGGDLTPEEERMRDRFRELRNLSDRFDDDLKRAMRRETELCVEHIARENGSLLDLLDCDYTFLNEALAEHYGIPGVEGDRMRRVTLPPDSPRGGVLTHASMLLVTSNPTRTSPVKRGLFVLENLLGTPAPPPPDSVPDLEESANRFGDREPSLRELLAAHRESALCASCHARMDPLGLALENFNALGMWRTEDNDQPIDASGTLITGESFRDVKELKRILRQNHAETFYRCVTQKLLTFAIGRGLEYSDEHTVDLIVERLDAGDGRFRALLDGVIESAPFQRQRRQRADVAAR